MIKTIESIIHSLNPGNVTWSNGGDVIVFFLYWILFIITVGLIIYTARNIRRIATFARDTILELRKVDWLSRKMTSQYSVITIVMLFIFTIFILGVDEVSLFIRNLFILRGN